MIHRFFYAIRGEFLLILFIFVATFSLQALNTRYQKVLAEREKAFHTALLKDLSIPFTEENMEAVLSERIEKKQLKGYDIFMDARKKRFAAVKGEENGLWGPVTLYFVMNIKKKKILKLSVLSHKETPGLGALIEEPWFLKQFVELDVSTPIHVGKSIKRGEVAVNAITGATITGNAVKTIINTGVQEALLMKENLESRKKNTKIKKRAGKK